MAAFNSQIPQAKVWGWIMENDLRVRASTRRGKKVDEIILQMSQTMAGLERWEKGLEVSTAWK
jgi:hypothetical protein